MAEKEKRKGERRGDSRRDSQRRESRGTIQQTGVRAKGVTTMIGATARAARSVGIRIFLGRGISGNYVVQVAGGPRCSGDCHIRPVCSCDGRSRGDISGRLPPLLPSQEHTALFPK